MASDADLHCSHLRYLNEIYAWLPVFLCRPPLGSTSSTYVGSTHRKTQPPPGPAAAPQKKTRGAEPHERVEPQAAGRTQDPTW